MPESNAVDTSIQNWAFRLGECVTINGRGCGALVMDRSLTLAGREVYDIKRIAGEATGEKRIMLGSALCQTVPRDEACRGCLNRGRNCVSSKQ